MLQVAQQRYDAVVKGQPATFDQINILTTNLAFLLYTIMSQVAQQHYDAVVKGQPERLVSGSDDHTMFLWTPSSSKSHIARMTGHVQLINQV
jgi:ribosome assembly protein 4